MDEIKVNICNYNSKNSFLFSKHENTTKYRKENAKDPNWDKEF